ncbi:MAG: hypothetical protein JWP01_2329 [Myxococcales bacterium]|nr:hypothetical protein [Myxococcales bacterium]
MSDAGGTNRYPRGMRFDLIVVVIALSIGCGESSQVSPTVDAASSVDPIRPSGYIDGACVGQPTGARVLVYTRENQYRHYSNLDARIALFGMCETRGFNVSSTNDQLTINARQLASFDVVVFAVTSGNGGIDNQGRADFEAWATAGGGIVGLHSASSTESDWPFYVDRIGAVFAHHENGLPTATVNVAATPHPITAGITSFQHDDEWYLFQTRPEDKPGTQVLLSLDEATLPSDYPAESKIGFHAIGWARENAGSRTFYTALGHTRSTFVDAAPLTLIGNAIEWAAHKR